MNILCTVFGIHRWKNIVRMLPRPEHRVATIPMVGHLWQHPSTWPVYRVPYVARYDVVGKECARCKARRKP